MIIFGKNIDSVLTSWGKKNRLMAHSGMTRFAYNRRGREKESYPEKWKNYKRESHSSSCFFCQEFIAKVDPSEEEYRDCNTMFRTSISAEMVEQRGNTIQGAVARASMSEIKDLVLFFLSLSIFRFFSLIQPRPSSLRPTSFHACPKTQSLRVRLSMFQE